MHCEPSGLTRREFMLWFSERWNRPICTLNPAHLVGSYFHRVECEEPAP